MCFSGRLELWRIWSGKPARASGQRSLSAISDQPSTQRPRARCRPAPLLRALRRSALPNLRPDLHSGSSGLCGARRCAAPRPGGLCSLPLAAMPDSCTPLAAAHAGGRPGDSRPAACRLPAACPLPAADWALRPSRRGPSSRLPLRISSACPGGPRPATMPRLPTDRGPNSLVRIVRLLVILSVDLCLLAPDISCIRHGQTASAFGTAICGPVRPAPRTVPCAALLRTTKTTKGCAGLRRATKGYEGLRGSYEGRRRVFAGAQSSELRAGHAWARGVARRGAASVASMSATRAATLLRPEQARMHKRALARARRARRAPGAQGRRIPKNK